MTFPLLGPSGGGPFVAFLSVITATFLNGIRNCVNQAVDGTGGGTYIPSPAISIEGDGLFADPFAGFVRSGKTLTIDNGGTLTSNASATVTFASSVVFSGITEFFGSENDVLGGVWKAFVDVYQLSSSTLHIGDDTVTGATAGHLAVGGTGSGAGSTVVYKGNTTVTYQNTSSATFQSGTSLSMQSGSTATLAGTNTISGATTLTAKLTKSGSAAKVVERFTVLTTTQTIADPSAQDVWFCEPAGGTGTIDITVNFAGGTPYGVRTRFAMPGAGVSGGNVNIHIGGTSAVIALGTGGTLSGVGDRVDLISGNNGLVDLWVPI